MRTLPHPVPITLCLVAALRCLSPSGAIAHERDEFWIINTRYVNETSVRAHGAEALRFQKRDENGSARASAADEFYASLDPSVPVVVYIHGNRCDYCTAIREGYVVHQVARCRSDEIPCRFVVWSWPSEEIPGGPRHDVQVKASRSDVQSYYLARWLESMDPGIPVGMIGYSFGSRIIGGALELLGGGCVAGRALDRAEERPRRLRAVFIAAAMDFHWLAPCRRDGLALEQSDGILVTKNACDPVLRWYPLMYQGCRGNEALGYVGPSSSTYGGVAAQRLRVLDVSGQVGKSHSWRDYLRSPTLRHYLAHYLYLEPIASDERLTRAP